MMAVYTGGNDGASARRRYAMPDFEASFGEFLDGEDYDKAENDLFSIARIAFTAGWEAAEQNPPPTGKTIELFKPPWTKPLENGPDSTETDNKN
jgi:hypothetical protein